MGLSGQAIDAIGREHAFRPITGDVLFIGRQTTFMTPAELAGRLRDHGAAVDEAAIEIDRTTFNRDRDAGFASDRSIFRALGNDRVRALDVSPYEGAEVIHNLNEPIPAALRECADFIVDGSTLDNVFDPAMALRNLAAMLRPGGRMLMVNAWNTREGAYTLCSASWFFDYFVINGFADARVYGCVSAGRSSNAYWLDPAFMSSPLARTRTPRLSCWWRRPFTVVMAEKAARSTCTMLPTQAHYRPETEWRAYLANLEPIKASPRPHLVRSIGRLVPRERLALVEGFVWIDGNFSAQRALSWRLRLIRRGWHAYRALKTGVATKALAHP
jgi:hypothetical protein